MSDILGLVAISVLVLAPAGGPVPAEPLVAKAYHKCLRAHSKSKLTIQEVRYSDELFASSLKECALKLPAPPWNETPVDQAYRSTQTYIATLDVLNSFKRPKQKVARSPVFVSTLESPPSDDPSAADRLDPFTSRDFSVLFGPWSYCLGSELKNKVAEKPEQYIGQAFKRCEKVSILADSEALGLLDRAGHYGDEANQQKVVADFKTTLSQLVLLGALRAEGENLGAALKRSEEAKQ